MSRALPGAVLAALLACSTARAQDPADARWQFELSVPVEAIGGHTTYTISDSDGVDSFTSELEFPLQGFMAGLRGRVLGPRLSDGTRWVFEGGVLHTLTEETGTVKDSDWIEGPGEALPPPDGVGAIHPGKDVFSTSKGFLRALTVDLRASWEHQVRSPALRLAPFAGLLYQSFSYVVVDVDQIGYGPYATRYTGRVGGRVATYDVGWRAIYLGLRGEATTGSVTLAADGWVSPLAAASDRDDHQLRQKISESRVDGWALQGRVEGRVALGALDSLSLQGSMVKFQATGSQSQHFYDGSGVAFSGIHAKLASLRWSAGLAWTHLFR